jgi:excinuclease UvrABC ATPase subunit
MSDIQHLLNVMNRLVDTGNTVIVIEHNLHVIKNADWIIDMGPEGGSKGGRIMFEGTPREILNARQSLTAGYLKN